MRWTPGKRSSNLEDRRGSGSGGLPIGRLGIGGTVVLLILSLVFKTDLTGMLGGGESPDATQPNAASGAIAAITRLRTTQGRRKSRRMIGSGINRSPSASLR